MFAKKLTRSLSKHILNMRSKTNVAALNLAAELEEHEFAPPIHGQIFTPADPIFMSQFMYTKEHVKEQLRESDKADMEKECALMLARLGGQLRAYYKATTGEFDGVVIYSFKKNHDVHTFEQIVKSSGIVDRMYTTKLMTSEDARVAMKAAKVLVDKFGSKGL
jgi:uncharacterized protein with GYD domain